MNSNTELFRCKIYEPSFKLIYNSYINKKNNEIIYYGGSSSGKSINIINNIIFFLPEFYKDEALIIVYSTLHKKNTCDLIKSILENHGYNYKVNSDISGDISIKFANHNKINIKSVETSNIASLEEKFKTGDGIKSNIKFLWFEEFTAILNSFRKIETFESAKSRIKRLLKKDYITFYSFNPPQKNHIIWKYIENFNGLKIFSTIYDLPEKWQDENSLEHADELKKNNNKLFRGLYLGEKTLNGNLAFDINEEIWIKNIDLSDYQKFFIQTDEATLNATTFSLIGLTFSGDIHFLTNYYHSSKIDGIKKSPSKYASDFKNWYDNLGVEVKEIVTDGLAFSEELKTLGFNSKSIGKFKDRNLSYVLLNKLILEKSFKIFDRKENLILYKQLKNAEIEYNKYNNPILSKKKENTNDNEYHLHSVDTVLYTCLILQKEILRSGKIK